MSSQTDVSALQVSQQQSNLYGVEDLRGKGKIRVADQDQLNSDLDPAFYFLLMLIRILLIA